MAKLNEEQLVAAKFFQTSKDNMAISALAGTGKTTFLLALTKMNKAKNCLFLAFTNATKDELIKREPSLGHRVKTTYSVGFSALKKFLDPSIEVKINKFKYNRILRDLINSSDFKGYAASMGYNRVDFFLKKEVLEELTINLNLCLSNLFFHKAPIWEFIKSHCIYSPSIEGWLIYHAITIGLSQVLEGNVGFADMVAFPFCPLVENPKDLFTTYPVLFVDEAQDLSMAQLEIVRYSLGNGQLIAVGDPNQAIFGFAGSNENSFQYMIDTFNCKTFDLTLCYRCPVEVLDKARELVPHIKGLERNGTVTELEDTQGGLDILSSIKEPLMVISRTNLSLLNVAMFLMEKGIPFTFHRDNIEQRLRAKIESIKDSVSIETLAAFLVAEVEEERRQSKVDINYSLILLLNKSGATKYSELLAFIRRTFFKKPGNILLGSVHSFKGNEEENVLIWGIENFPHPMSQSKSELQQETNLLYVAYTRAKQNLYLVDTRN